MKDLAKIFRALSNPYRLAIYQMLRERAAARGKGEVCVCHIAEPFRLALSTVSHHLKELREAGLIRCEKRGQWVYCVVDPEATEKVEAFFRESRPKVERRRALAG